MQHYGNDRHRHVARVGPSQRDAKTRQNSNGAWHQIYYLGGSDHRAYLEQQQMRFVSLAEGLRPQTRSSQLDVMEFLSEASLHCRPLDEYFTHVIEVFSPGDRSSNQRSET